MIYQSERYPAQIISMHNGAALEFKFSGHLDWLESVFIQNEDDIKEIMINPVLWLDTYIDQALADFNRNRLR